MLLTLIRHGKTLDAHNKVRQEFHAPLAPQSIEALTKYSNHFKDKSYTAIYASPQERARHTAELLFGLNNFQILEEIHEQESLTHMRGKPVDQILAYLESLPDSVHHDPDENYGGGESFNDTMQRIKKLHHYLQNNHADTDHVVIVGHGTFFRLLIGYLFTAQTNRFTKQIFSDFWRHFGIENACTITLETNLQTHKTTIRELSNWEIM